MKEAGIALTRDQELTLIRIGLEAVLNRFEVLVHGIPTRKIPLRRTYKKRKVAILESTMRRAWKAKKNVLRGEGAYKGRHWMQDPRNKKKVMAMVAKMKRGAAAKRAQEKKGA